MDNSPRGNSLGVLLGGLKYIKEPSKAMHLACVSSNVVGKYLVSSNVVVIEPMI